MSTNSEAMTLALARRLAIADKRPQQAAIVQTARLLRAETKNKDTYESLGIFLTSTPAERQKVLEVTERMFLAE